MLNGPRSRTRSPLAVAIMACAVMAVSLSLSGTAGSADAAKPTFIGPVLGRDESATLTLGRDNGISVALPNGRDFWLFGDTPQFHYQQGSWKLTNFIYGTSAGEENYTSGQRLASPLYEVVIGRKLANKNQATQFLPLPWTYLPDGSGRRCNKVNGGRTAEAGRWVTGAALLPDHYNILITYVDVCVSSAAVFRVQGWGFTEYNWRINKFSVGATDVFRPATSGAEIPSSQFWGSPIVTNNTVTLYSTTCCSPGSVYTATMPANTAAFRNPASYVPHPVTGLPPTFWLTVARPSHSQPHLTMFQATGTKGQYMILTASDPSGPWTYRASGIVPKCDTSPAPCTTFYVHPELSSPTRLLVSYFLPDYGPGISTRHPFPHHPLDHLVWATIPT
jgi:hypothetical protein